MHERSRETLKRLQASASFRSLLQSGLKAPAATAQGNLTHLKVPAETKDAQGKVQEEIVGLVVRNPGDIRTLSGADLKNAAILIVIKDLEPEAVAIANAAHPVEWRDGVEEPRDPGGG